MPSLALRLLAATLMIATATASATAQKAAAPDFSSNLAGWVGLNGGGPFYEPILATIPRRDRVDRVLRPGVRRVVLRSAGGATLWHGPPR